MSSQSGMGTEDRIDIASLDNTDTYLAYDSKGDLFNWSSLKGKHQYWPGHTGGVRDGFFIDDKTHVVTIGKTDKAVKLAKDFISGLAPLIPQEQAEYLFGK